MTSPDDSAAGRPSSGVGWWLTLAAVVAVVVIAMVVGLTTVLGSRGTGPTDPPLDPGSDPVSTPPSAGRSGPASPGPPGGAGAPVRVRAAGRPLLPDAGSDPVWARSVSAVFRIDLASGEVVRTGTPALEAHSTLVAGRNWVVMKAVTGSEGSLVREGSPAEPLPAALRGDGWLNRGPGNRIWWTPEQPAYPALPQGDVRLVDLDGRVIPDRSIAIEPDVGAPVDSDGYGGLLLDTRVGVYQITPSTTRSSTPSTPAGTRRPGQVRLVSRGSLLGVGGRRLLIWDCDARARCGVYLVDQRSSRRVLLPAAAKALTAATGGGIEGLIYGDGLLSPDGRHLAFSTANGSATWQIHVVDLIRGRDVVLPGVATESNANRQLTWTPNSRWLLALTSRRIRAFDTRTRATRTVTVTDEQLLHLTGPRTPGP